MSEQILYKLRIEGTDAALQSLKEINDQIAQSKKEIKEAGDVGSKENEQRKTQLKQQQEDYRKLQAAVKDRNKAEEEGAKTLEKMRAQLRNLNKEMDKTPINTKRFKDLTAQSKKLRDEIKGADEATGRFQGNVGNYKGAIMDAFRQMGINVGGLTTAIGTASTGMKGLSAATGGSTKAMKIFRLALISTGIGAIVVAFGLLVTAILSTQAGMDKLNKILIPIGNVLQRIFGFVQDLGTGLLAMVSGDISGGFDKIKDSVNGLGEGLREAWQEGERLYEITILLRNQGLAIAANEGNINREIAKRRAILENVNESDRERLKAGNEILQYEEALKQLKLQELDLLIEEARIKKDQNDTDAEAQKAFVQLINQKAQLEADVANKNLRIKNKINSIEKKANDERIKEIEYREKIEQDIVDNLTKSIDKLISENKRLISESLEDLDEPDIDEDEVDEGLAIIEKEEARAAILEEFRQQRLSAEQKELEKYKSLKDQQLITDQEYEEKKSEVEKKYADINKQIKQQEINGKLSMASNALGQLSEIAGKETKVGKAAAVAQATINTYLAASSAFASAGNPILGAILAAIAVAAGLLQVQKIVSVKTDVPKFARGVIGLNGSGSETSDSIDAKLSRGESVMTAKATRAYAPMLADMERSVGNKPNIHLRNRKFAGGFIGGTISPRTDYPTDYERVMEQTINNITQIPVTVTETDITSTQNKVRQIKVTGDL
jgi:hypothetical protein